MKSSEFVSTEFGKRAKDVISNTTKALIERNYDSIPADNIRWDMNEEWAKALDEYMGQDRSSYRIWTSDSFSETYSQQFSDGTIVIEPFLPMLENGVLVDSGIRMTFEFRCDGSVQFEGLKY